MGMLNKVFTVFEGMIDPFKPRKDYEPPNKLLEYVWFYVSQVKWAFLALLIYGFANAIVEATVFSYVGQLVDILTQFDGEGDKSLGWAGLLAAHGPKLLVMLLVVAVLRLVIVTAGALIEEQVIVPGFFVLMRWQSHKHIIGQSLSFFQNDLAGRISQKVFQSGMATGDMMIALLQVIWFVVTYAFTTAALLLALDLKLGAVIVIWIIIFIAIARYFVPKVREHARITAEKGAVLTGHMVDGYSNIQTVKLHGEEAGDQKVLEAMKIQRKASIQFTRVLTLMRVSLSLANGIIISLIAWMSVDLWLGGEASLGSVAFVMALVLRLHLLSNRLLSNLNGFFRNMGVAQNTMGLVAQPHEITDAPDAKAFHFKGGEVRFEDVSFHYDKKDGIIDALSLYVKAGERIGIVGPSGAGKTTLVHLLMRFFDPESGKITIDGQDITKVKQDSLRECFSLVQQDAQLFHASVFENIAFGDREASQEKVEAAAKLAQAHEFILELQDVRGEFGYSARVGERGVKLSGGQRQRIAIARALYRDAPILVLDEATSQLDSGVEQAIQQNLDRLMQNKTCFIIAHRLSTIAGLDRLIVMEKGKIVEEGTHAQLVDKGGIYAKMWARQSKAEADTLLI